jgi:4,5-dihydroxyphthalate decarboxylase
MAKPLNLTLGLSENPRTMALFDGTVQPEGFNLTCRSQFSEGYDNTGARHRWILEGKIPGGECSTSSIILAWNRSIRMKILPVFLSRAFRHRCIFCPATSTMESPRDLGGKKVTVHRYNATTSVWVRGLIRNEYGVNPSEMDWYVAEPDVGEEGRRPKPEGVRVQFIAPPRTREHAIELVEEEKIDAALEPYPSLAEHPRLRRFTPMPLCVFR